MHDIDRTQFEMGWETDEYEYESEGEMEGEYELYGETPNQVYGSLYGEMYDETELTHGLFTEMDEMELAADLLEVTDEAELEQFLGNLMHKASRVAGGTLRTPEGNMLGGVLKGIARKALPNVDAGLGRLAHSVDGTIGRQLAANAGHLFGLEMEGMSAEDQEFEVARRFVHLAGDAVQNVLQAKPKVSLANAVQKAVATAAQQHAPGLLKLAASALKSPSHNDRPHPRRKLIEVAKAKYAGDQEVTRTGLVAASPFSEAEEMELAAELLEITDEAELEQFLGKLFKKAAGGLKGLAKKALPFVGGALGSLIPIPGVGTAVGSALGGAVGKALEMELGELNAEDQEFETARRVVRVVGSAAQKIAQAQPDADPQTVVRKAVTEATHQHVPSLANSRIADPQPRAAAHAGRWERRGRTIVLLDL